jgi:hypothetical protein
MTVPVPQGLGPRSAGIWRKLTTQHHFADFELVTFERALRWFDKADAWLVESAGVTGPDQARLVKQSMDASNCGLRYWRTLKFVDGAARRPGRPSDDSWSAKRRLQKVG